MMVVRSNAEGIMNSECFEIFVSKFPSSTEYNAITVLILETSKLQVDNFEVVKIVNPKTNIKYCKFMSFKITACDKSVYDDILNDNIWAVSKSFRMMQKRNPNLSNVYNKNQFKNIKLHKSNQHHRNKIISNILSRSVWVIKTKNAFKTNKSQQNSSQLSSHTE